MRKDNAVRVGDKFQHEDGEHVLEVTFTRPGGHVELFDRERSRFYHRYCRDVKAMKRIEQEG